MLQRPRGTRDFAPEEMTARRALETRLRATVQSFGYNEIATPTFEHLELFVNKSGADITKQLYNFKDKGERDITLRPELTAPVMRFYFSDLKMRPKPLKIFYFGNCFRYERPQDGRYREFWQFGAEIIGVADKHYDNAELLNLAMSCLRASGLKGFLMRVGHVGILKAVLVSLGLGPEQQKYAMPLIDKGEYQGLEDYLKEQRLTPQDISYLLETLQQKMTLDELIEGKDALSRRLERSKDAQQALADFYEMVKLIKEMGVSPVVIDLGIARGLDYYTGMVFEVDLQELGAEKQVCGGGAYNLEELFEVKERMDATGFAIGFDRVMLGLTRQNYVFERPFLDAFVIPMSRECLTNAIKVLGQIHGSGLRGDMELAGRGMGKSIKHAEALNAGFAVIIGEDELKKGVASVKDLAKRAQEEVALDDVAAHILSKKAK